MQREIKFRFWDKDGGVMTHSDDMRCLDFCGLLNEYAMQFTGLTDKNGKEIYESDWVEYSGKRYRVDWVGAGFWFVDVDTSTEDIEPIPNVVAFTEVVGNIYESPELIK